MRLDYGPQNVDRYNRSEIVTLNARQLGLQGRGALWLIRRWFDDGLAWRNESLTFSPGANAQDSLQDAGEA